MSGADDRRGSDPGADIAPADDWSYPLPAHMPSTTFWPAGLAFGITLLLWGVVTSLVIVAFGGAAIVVALAGWIGEIRREAKAQ